MWGAEGSKEIQGMKIRWVVAHCLVLAAANCYQRFSVYFCGLVPDGCGRPWTEREGSWCLEQVVVGSR